MNVSLGNNKKLLIEETKTSHHMNPREIKTEIYATWYIVLNVSFLLISKIFQP